MCRSFCKKLSFLRNIGVRRVSTKEVPVLMPFAAGKAMDCRHQFKSEVHRRYIGGTSEVGRRHSGGNLCLTLFLKRRVGAGQVQGRCRVLFLGRVLKISTTGRKKF